MTDDKTNRGPADGSRINVNEDYELRATGPKNSAARMKS